MSKQGIIREGIEKLLHQAMYASAKVGAEKYTDIDASHDVKRILQYLHSQGVAIVVEGELPECEAMELWGCPAIKAGYKLTIPLVG